MLEVPNRQGYEPEPEAIFGLSGVGLGPGETMRHDEMDYMARLQAMIDDAVDYENSYLQGIREENMGYYIGQEPRLQGSTTPGSGGDNEQEPNRSTFISTDVRDTILTILPSLIRIFMSSERIANFVPTNEAGQPMADMAYDYCNYVFYKDNPGFLILHGALKDAMTVRGGIVKWWTDHSIEVTEQSYSNLTEEQYMYLLSEMPDAEVVEMEPPENQPEGSEVVVGHLTVRFKKSKPLVKVAGIPPEEFRISKTAKDIKSAPLVGHEWVATRSELIQLGVPEEALDEVGTSNILNFSEERYFRNPALVDGATAFINDGIQYGEYFVRIDKDGDGIDELRKICTLGSAYVVVMDQAVTVPNMAMFCVDPTPHTAIGDDIAELTKDIQKYKSNMIRGQFDQLAETINPRMVVNELITNIEDALSDEVGAIIRTRGDPNAAVAYTRPVYAGAEIQDSVNYMDQVRASRTGITEASKGLDPKAMQSTALSGIDAIVSGAQERIELIARILAETGYKDLMEGILREVVNNPNHARQIKLQGKWATINPSVFDPNMTLEVNPTLGKGSDMMRLQALADVRGVQETVITKFGIANPIVTPQHYMNTVQDMLEIANIKNFNRYFGTITPELMESIQSAPKEPDPTEVLAQAEMEKVKATTLKIIGETDNNQTKNLLAATKQKQDDDFRRDKLNIDAMLEAAALFGDTIRDVSSSEGILGLNQPPEA